MTTIQEKIAERTNKLIKQLNALSLVMTAIEGSNIEVNDSFFIDCVRETIDFNYPSREMVEKLLFHLKGGKWIKDPVMDKINYTTEKPIFGEYYLRLYCADPPNSCRVVKKTVHVPESLIPAHDKTEWEIICTDEEGNATQTI